MVHIHTYARTPLAETTLIFLVPAVCVQTIRRLMIDMILGTDMKLHMNHVKTFQTYLGRSIATVCRGTERERSSNLHFDLSPPPLSLSRAILLTFCYSTYFGLARWKTTNTWMCLRTY